MSHVVPRKRTKPYSLTLKSKGFIQTQNKSKTTLRNDDQEMQKKSMKKAKKAAGQKECISKSTKLAKGSHKKMQPNAKELFKQRKTKANKPHKACTCTTKFYTPLFLSVYLYLQCCVLCAILHIYIYIVFFFFWRFVFAFLLFKLLFQGNAHNIQKQQTTQKDRQSKGIDCFCFAFCLHFLCFVFFCLVFALCFAIYSPNSVDTLGVLTVSEKQLMLRSLKRAAVTGKFAAIYSTFTPLDIVNVEHPPLGSHHEPSRPAQSRTRRASHAQRDKSLSSSLEQ